MCHKFTSNKIERNHCPIGYIEHILQSSLLNTSKMTVELKVSVVGKWKNEHKKHVVF